MANGGGGNDFFISFGTDADQLVRRIDEHLSAVEARIKRFQDYLKRTDLTPPRPTTTPGREPSPVTTTATTPSEGPARPAQQAQMPDLAGIVTTQMQEIGRAFITTLGQMRQAIERGPGGSYAAGTREAPPTPQAAAVETSFASLASAADVAAAALQRLATGTPAAATGGTGTVQAPGGLTAEQIIEGQRLAETVDVAEASLREMAGDANTTDEQLQRMRTSLEEARQAVQSFDEEHAKAGITARELVGVEVDAIRAVQAKAQSDRNLAEQNVKTATQVREEQAKESASSRKVQAATEEEAAAREQRARQIRSLLEPAAQARQVEAGTPEAEARAVMQELGQRGGRYREASRGLVDQLGREPGFAAQSDIATAASLPEIINRTLVQLNQSQLQQFRQLVASYSEGFRAQYPRGDVDPISGQARGGQFMSVDDFRTRVVQQLAQATNRTRDELLQLAQTLHNISQVRPGQAVTASAIRLPETARPVRPEYAGMDPEQVQAAAATLAGQRQRVEFQDLVAAMGLRETGAAPQEIMEQATMQRGGSAARSILEYIDLLDREELTRLESKDALTQEEAELRENIQFRRAAIDALRAENAQRREIPGGYGSKARTDRQIFGAFGSVEETLRGISGTKIRGDELRSFLSTFTEGLLPQLEPEFYRAGPGQDTPRHRREVVEFNELRQQAIDELAGLARTEDVAEREQISAQFEQRIAQLKERKAELESKQVASNQELLNLRVAELASAQRAGLSEKTIADLNDQIAAIKARMEASLRRQAAQQAGFAFRGQVPVTEVAGELRPHAGRIAGQFQAGLEQPGTQVQRAFEEFETAARALSHAAEFEERAARTPIGERREELLAEASTQRRVAAASEVRGTGYLGDLEGFRGQFAILDRFMDVISSPRFAQMPEALRQNVAEHLAQTVERAGTTQAREAAAVIRQAPAGAWAADPTDPTAQFINQRRQQLARAALQETMQRYEGVRFSQRQLEGVDVVRRIGGQGPRAGQIALTSEAAQIVKSAVGEAFPRVQQEMFGRLIDEGRISAADLTETQPAQLRQASEDVAARLEQAERRAQEGAPEETRLISVLRNLNQAINKLAACCERFGQLQKDVQQAPGRQPGVRDPNQMRLLADEVMEGLAEGAPVQTRPQEHPGLTQRQMEQQTFAMERAMELAALRGQRGGYAVPSADIGRIVGAEAQERFGAELTPDQLKALQERIQLTRAQAAADEALSRAETEAASGTQVLTDAQFRANEAMSVLSTQTRQQVQALRQLRETTPQAVQQTPEFQTRYRRQEAQTFAAVERELQGAARGTRVSGDVVGDILDIPPDRRAEVVKNARVTVSAQTQAVVGEMNTLRRAALELFGTNGFISRMINSTGTFIVRQFSALLVFGTINALQRLGEAALEAEQTFVRVEDALAATGRSAQGVQTALQDIAVQTNVAVNDTYSVMSNLVGVFDTTAEAMDATRLVNQLELISQGALSAREGYRSLSAVAGAFYEQFRERGFTDEEAITHIADVATRIQDLTSVNIEDTIEGLGRLGETARQMGVDAELMASALALAVKATGQNGQAASEQLGRVFSQLQNAPVQDLLVQIGVTDQAVVDARDFQQVILDLFAAFPDLSAAEQGAIARALGGERQFATTIAFLRQGTKALEVFNEAQNATGASAERAEKILDTLRGRIGQLGKQVQVLVQNLINLGLFDFIGLLVEGFSLLLKPINEILQAINRLGEMSFIADWATRIGILVGQFVLLRKVLRGVVADSALGGMAAGMGAGLLAPFQRAPATGTYGARLTPGAASTGVTPAPATRTLYHYPGARINPAQYFPVAPVVGAHPAVSQQALRAQGTRIGGVPQVSLYTPPQTRLGRVGSAAQARATAASQRAVQGLNRAFTAVVPRVTSLASALSRAMPALLGVAFAVDLVTRNSRDLNRRLRDLATIRPERDEQPETPQEARGTAIQEARDEALRFRGIGGFRDMAVDKLRYAFSSPGRFFDPLLPGRQGGVGASAASEGTLEQPFVQDADRIRKRLVELAQETPTKEVFDEVAKLKEEIVSEGLLDSAGSANAQIANALSEIQGLENLAGSVGDKLVRVQAGMTNIVDLSLAQISNWNQAFQFMNGLSQQAFRQSRQSIELLLETQNIPEEFRNQLTDLFSGGIGDVGGAREATNALAQMERQAQTELKQAKESGEPERIQNAQQALQAVIQARAQANEQLLSLLVEEPTALAEFAAHEGNFEQAANEYRRAARELQAQASELEGPERLRTLAQARELAMQAIEAGLQGEDLAASLRAAQIDDPTEQALLELDTATRRLEAYQAAGEGTVSAEAINEAQVAVENAHRALRDSLDADADALAQTAITMERDPTARARLELELATSQLERASERGTQAYEQARQALIQAQQALADSIHQDAQAILQTRAAQTRDPLSGARIELQIAQRELQHAQQTGAGTQAVQSAIQSIISSERAIEDELDAIISSRAELAMAIAQVAGLDIEVADLQLQEARRTLEAARGRGAGEAELNQLRAEAIRAEGALRDVRYQEQLDFIDFQLQMEQITANAAISMLQEMLTWTDITEDQRRQLQLKIKGLQDDLRNQLAGGFNIPGEIDLPTAYEVRRSLGLDATGGMNNIQTNVVNANIQNQFTFTVTSDAQAQQIAERVSTSIEQQLSKQVNAHQPTPHLVGM